MPLKFIICSRRSSRKQASFPQLYSASSGVNIGNGVDVFFVATTGLRVLLSVDFLRETEEAITDFWRGTFLMVVASDSCLLLKLGRDELLVRSLRALFAGRVTFLPIKDVSENAK